MPTPRVYRWDAPLDWLIEASDRWDAAQLRAELLNLARRLGSDDLQDEFQTDMARDGYFQPEGEEEDA
jgi:hypothetical protein